MGSIVIRARNFRVFDSLEWSPAGVCLLAGANGTGKTTILDVLRFLRALFSGGHEQALLAVDGDNFRYQGAPGDEPVTFEVEHGEVRWTLRFPMSAVGLKGTYGEELRRGDELVLHASMFDEGWYLGSERMPLDTNDGRCCARVLWDKQRPPWLEPFAAALAAIRVHETFPLARVRESGATDAQASFLHSTGTNLWSVLANWKGAPLRYRGQFDWVIARARAAFPDTLGSLEFDRGQPFLYRPGATDPADGLPPRRAADGLLTGLLQLTAVVGAQAGSILAFDEIENQLHPHAIRTIISAMRDQAEQRDLTIILTTHSPVVMNTFRTEPHQFFVLQPGATPQPTPLTELHDEDWLAAFSLGDLYDRLEIAAPKIDLRA